MKFWQKLGLVGTMLGALAGSAKAGTIKTQNYTSNTSVGLSSLYGKNISGATEGYMPYDGSFLSSPYTNALEISTKVEGNQLSTDARPIETHGWNFDLAVKGNVTCDNSLKFKVTDTAGLEGKAIYAWDIANPGVKYSVTNVLNAITTVGLPALVNQSEGEYAHWRLALYAPGEVVSAGLLGDANNDTKVDVGDLGILGANYGSMNANWNQGDFTGDGKVDVGDLGILGANYGAGSGGAESVPEPASGLALIVLGGIALAGKRKRE